MKYPLTQRSTKAVEIKLGLDWRRFAFPCNDLEFLGTIRRGIEIGALAKNASGDYLQVNGDMRQALNKARVEANLRSAGARAPAVQLTPQPSDQARAAVNIVIKPRRRVLGPQD